MADRTDFEDFYPGGGTASPAYAAPAAATDPVARAALKALADAAAALPAIDPDGGESLADVKQRQNDITAALAAV